MNGLIDNKSIIGIFSELEGIPYTLTPLTGGITNTIFRIKSDLGDWAVRFYGENTELFIDRNAEVKTIKLMAEIGISPKLIHFFPEKRITSVEFIDFAKTLNNDDFLNESYHKPIMDTIHNIHSSDVKLSRIFNPIIEIEKMLKILESLGVDLSEFDIDHSIPQLHELDQRLNIPDNQYVPCHIDLLAENFLSVKHPDFPTGLAVIDWEYAGMAPAAYDIADMLQEALMPNQLEKKLIHLYCKGNNENEFWRKVQLFKPFPDFYWFLWPLIQKEISKIDFDFYTYGKGKYKNAVQNMNTTLDSN